jgi:hypothetical protein
MEGTLGNITASFGVAFEKMAASVAQSESMAKTMNAMMEGVLLNSLKVTSNVSFSKKSEQPELLLTVENASRFPIPKVSIQIACSEKGVKGACLMESEDSGTTLQIKFNEAPRRIGCKRKHEDNVCLNTGNAVDVAPSSKLLRRFVLHPYRLAQYNLQITIQFPSPGTGRVLEQTHTCGLYYLHQGKVALQNKISTPKKDTNVHAVPSDTNVHAVPSVPATLLRSLLRIGPSRGLELGPKQFYLLKLASQQGKPATTDVCILLEQQTVDGVDDASESGEEAEDPLFRVVISTGETDGDVDGCSAAARLVAEELSRLQRHHHHASKATGV